MNSTNLRLPAEWERHKSTIICWPHQKADWPSKFSPIPWVYTEIVKNILPQELVRIIVQTEGHKKKVETQLTKAHVFSDKINFIIAETDRGWMRDISPAFVYKRNQTIAVKFKFNGWAKYKNWQNDQTLPEILSRNLNLKLIKAKYKDKDIVLEGGAIDTNGHGTLITTEECLLDQNTQVRNPKLNKEDYQNIFSEYLGIKNIIWLNKGIAGDDTHGHVDDLCRFVNKNTVVICSEKNKNDTNYFPLNENYNLLKESRLEDGTKLNIVKLPMPHPLYFDNMRLPASYANFYISNNAVLVPTFNDVNDQIALNIISKLFKDRKVIGIHSVDLVWGLGTLHCLTHEEPL